MVVKVLSLQLAILLLGDRMNGSCLGWAALVNLFYGFLGGHRNGVLGFISIFYKIKWFGSHFAQFGPTPSSGCELPQNSINL